MKPLSQRQPTPGERAAKPASVEALKPAPARTAKPAPERGAQGAFPAVRMRRTRRTRWSRRLVAENALTPSDLIWPIFIVDGRGVRAPVPSMPGVERLSVDLAVAAAEEAAALGIPAVALFP
jgi:porphobilinogen synthase